MKKCSSCGKEKPETAFYRLGGKGPYADRLRSECKFCRGYKQSNSPVAQAWRVRYREANREKMRVYHREYMKRQREETHAGDR